MKNNKKLIINKFKQVIESFCGDDVLFAFCYGGFVNQDVEYNGDLDILIVTRNEVSFEKILEFKQLYIGFCRQYKLVIDEEVCIENKIIISMTRLMDALSLRAFYDTEKKNWFIEQNFSSKYLNSDYFIDRLILNAITCPNVFIFGSKKEHKKYRKVFFFSLKKLVQNLFNNKSEKVSNLTNSLFAPQGVFYKDYLGYNPTDKIKRHLNYHFREMLGKQ